MRVQQLIVVGFFAEMEVWSNGMLEEMDDQVSDKD